MLADLLLHGNWSRELGCADLLAFKYADRSLLLLRFQRLSLPDLQLQTPDFKCARSVLQSVEPQVSLAAPTDADSADGA